jgi:hypothetical protein
MAMNTATTSADFEIGRVVSRMFQVIGDNAVTFFGLSLLAAIPSLLFTFAFVGTRSGVIGSQIKQSPLSSAALPTIIGGALVGFLIYIVFAYLLQAALVYGTISTLNGRKASFTDCLATGVQHALPLTVIAILALLGFMLGFLLLIVPGVILALMWSVLTPVRVTERTGILETFGRSAALTRGYRGSIFGLAVIYMVLVVVVDLIVRPLTGLSVIPTSGPRFSISYIIVTALVRVVLHLVAATGVASIYYELRMVKEGIGPEQLAAVFA